MPRSVPVPPRSEGVGLQELEDVRDQDLGGVLLAVVADARERHDALDEFFDPERPQRPSMFAVPTALPER